MTKKSTFVPAKDLSKLWRAIIEFDMLQPGDRILVGLSGGKDSMLLTAMLAEIKKIFADTIRPCLLHRQRHVRTQLSQGGVGSLLRAVRPYTLQRRC